MRIPFFGKKEIIVSTKRVTVEDKYPEAPPVTLGTLESYKNKFNGVYAARVAENTKILDAKLEVANLWIGFIKEEIKDIPKEYISCVGVEQDPKNDLESIIWPDVFVYIEVTKPSGKSEKWTYKVFAYDHDQTQNSVYSILENIKALKKEIKKTEGDIDTLIKGASL